ncbi:ATP-binding protein [Prosthecobacter sp.]|uniref:ATP-binding protein n=1 Tax=Prosthecobacter sp. TaxID=1965333 RepID=UPI0037851437
MSNVQFKISSALKTIIGKELITDDFIAMFELVKNSFDANAKRVNISIESLGTNGAKIVIQDNGDGMDKEDIIGKWLFVAYSAKKKQQDYRDKIAGGRIFAGAKGIGRFSCDRLGAGLKMYSKKKGQKGAWHVLEVDWNKFEVDAEKEFQKIPARYTSEDAIPYDVRHGTVLEITGLRSSDWGREKILRLRRSLERLVNPNQENDAENFQINLNCPDERIEDERIREAAEERQEEVQAWQLVNGPIRNFVFESLELRTAQIFVEVIADGSEIRTCLTDRGRRVYELIEKSPYSVQLDGVKITLFALNQASKNAFTRRMGMRVHDYGSVFLYKNGFRIHPFGDPGDDELGIDKRHQQGFFRTLGTRDLSGRIEVNGANSAFQETSSRDGGLIENKAFTDLKELMIEVALKRLETFAIDLAKFGTEKGELPDATTMSKAEVKQAIFEIITKLTRSKDVLLVEYDADFLNILENRSAESVSALLGNLKRMAAQQNSPKLAKEVSKAEKQLKRLSKAKEEAEIGEARERERAKKAEEKAKESQAKAMEAEEAARRAVLDAQEAKYRESQLDTQNVFLKSMLSKDLEHVLSLHHSIGQDAQTIEQYVFNLLDLLKENSTPRPEQMKVYLERISYRAKRINAITRFATQANHVAAQEEVPGDLVEFIREYLLNIYHGYVLGPQNKTIPIRFHQASKAKFPTTFAPISVSIIFDNLISNARKTQHKVSGIDVAVVEATNEKLVIRFCDDGVGIPKRNMPHLFDVGFSTTDGSGLGLHHVKEILSEMDGEIKANAGQKKGAEFILTFHKR